MNYDPLLGLLLPFSGPWARLLACPATPTLGQHKGYQRGKSGGNAPLTQEEPND